MERDWQLCIMCISTLVVLAACDAEESGQQSPLVTSFGHMPPAKLEEILAGLPTLPLPQSSDYGKVYRMEVEAKDALVTWEHIKPAVAKLGYYPLVCRDEHGMLADLPEINPTQPTETLRIAAEIDGAKWFDQRVAEEPGYYAEVELGDWQETKAQRGWAVPFDVLTGKPADGVWIALVPTTKTWEVLAYLHYGGWNECPAAEEHVAVQRFWYERFGAEIVCVSGDIVEMHVPRPPDDREAALALAREQFIYSGGDLVFQGYGELNKLAAALLGAEYWYFWWD